MKARTGSQDIKQNGYYQSIVSSLIPATKKQK